MKCIISIDIFVFQMFFIYVYGQLSVIKNLLLYFYVLSDPKTMKQIENLIITFQKEKNEMIVYVLTILIESVEQQ